MAGLYIHVPFCRRKCHYCNFFSLATKKFRTEYVDALNLDFQLNKDYLEGQPVETIYIGGGTPSLLDPEVFRPFLSAGSKPSRPADLSLSGSRGTLPTEMSEFTMEVNPEDVNRDYIKRLLAAGINRVSMGVQSFFDDDLHYLNREHSGEQAVSAVRLMQEAGLQNISVDLIYGIPGSDDFKWRKNLEIVFDLEVPHLSAYALTVETGTPLDWMIRHHRSAPVDENTQVRQFRLLMEMARDKGFEHYEISNFAKPGHYARHNTSYWNGIPYLGIGPSAHSYNGHSRRWNVSNLGKYLSNLQKGESYREEEVLTTAQQYNEYVMTSLRTSWGCRAEILQKNFGESFAVYFARHSMRFIQRGWLTESNGICRLTDEGKLFADHIAAELFHVSGNNRE